MEPKRTLTIVNWDHLRDDDDDDDHFFESVDRKSSATPLDLEASSSDDEDFDDCRMSFSSTVRRDELVNFVGASSTTLMLAPPSPDYDVWMMAPGSIKERRKRLFQGMGLTSNKSLLPITSVQFPRAISKKIENEPMIENVVSSPQSDEQKPEPLISVSSSPSPFPILLVRSRSEGDIEAFSFDKRRKEDLFGRVSKQRLTRTNSMIFTAKARMYPESVRVSPRVCGGSNRTVRKRGGGAMTPLISKTRFGAFLLIKNLDTGKEFIVNEADQEGRWNKLSDVQTGKQLTVEEFDKCVGYSPVVKELMRRANGSHINGENERKLNAFSKSLRVSKKKVANLKNSIKGLSHSVSGLMGEKDREIQPTPPLEQKQAKNESSSEWVKVRSSGKSIKEFSALHLCQEIQAHEGSIWTIKFSWDAHYLASAGEDKIIHVWEVQECEVMSLREDGGTTPLHPSLCNSPIHPSLRPSPDRSAPLGDPTLQENEKKKKKGKCSTSRKCGNLIPDYVHVPETVFALSEKPICSFKGHLDDVLDLSWSMSQLLLSSSMDKTVRLWDIENKSCLKLFAHNDYVTCVHFNPTDEDYYISGSLDAKVRIWDIPKRQVVDWTDLHEMVTAVCYNPDGQSVVIGSHKGSCRTYDADENKLTQTSQIQLQNKKKSQIKKITGFQFSPTNPSEVLVTSADSRIRVVDGSNVVHKFKGFRNTSSQIAASFSQDGKYVICASEDSQVYIWRRDEQRTTNPGNKKVVTTQSYEQFQCKDISAAVFWPGTIRGQPPPLLALQTKKNSKISQPLSACCSPTKEDNSALANNKRLLPPLPKKKNTNPTSNSSETNNHSSPPEEEKNSQICRSESRIGESLSSEGCSSRFNDPSSISASPTPTPSSSSWSSSWSWLDIGGNQNQPIQATAWGLVIVTAGIGGEIKAYQNFGIPRKVGR